MSYGSGPLEIHAVSRPKPSSAISHEPVMSHEPAFVASRRTARQALESITASSTPGRARARLLEPTIDIELIAPLRVLPALHFAFLRRHDFHLCTRSLERLLRFDELNLFESVIHECCDALIAQFVCQWTPPFVCSDRVQSVIHCGSGPPGSEAASGSRLMVHGSWFMRAHALSRPQS